MKRLTIDEIDKAVKEVSRQARKDADKLNKISDADREAKVARELQEFIDGLTSSITRR